MNPKLCILFLKLHFGGFSFNVSNQRRYVDVKTGLTNYAYQLLMTSSIHTSIMIIHGGVLCCDNIYIHFAKFVMVS